MDTTDFLKWLFSYCEIGNINLRFISKESKDSQFAPVGKLHEDPSFIQAIIKKNIDRECYFAPALRKVGGKGTKDAILQIPVVWVDDGNLEKAKAEGYPCPPSAIVQTSPGRYHFYWKLKEPLAPGEISACEGILRRLAICFEGDKGSCDASHCLRLPGTLNHKYSPPAEVSVLQEPTGKEYTLADLDDFLPSVDSCNSGAAPTGGGAHGNKINNMQGGVWGGTGAPSDFSPFASSTDQDFDFQPGQRNQSLFHLGRHLVKSQMGEKNIRNLFDFIAQKADGPPIDEAEKKALLKSAREHEERKNINFAREVRALISVTSGDFSVTNLLKEIQSVTTVTKRDKTNMRKILSRLCEEGVIERTGTKDGVYRRVENVLEPVNYLAAPTEEFPIIFPLGIHLFCIIYPGNIIIIAGSKDAGKTAFLLNVAKLNQDRYEIVYLNSEMGDTEFRKRLEKFEDMKLTDWKMKAFFRAEKFEDVITDAKKIFIIDYLELNKDFYRVAETIQAIHKKLKDGICIIALQKDPGHELGRGNTFSIEKSRLYLTLDRVPGQKMNRLKIVSAKAWRTAQNPRDMFRNYSLVNGSKFITQGNWAE